MTVAAIENWNDLDAGDVIARALEASERPCLTCSFQAEDMVLLDLVRRHRPEIPVLFLETGYHFRETYLYRDRFVREWSLNLRNLQTDLSVKAQESRFGILYQSDPGRCCQIRKVEPLFGALEEYDAWFTGLRREQSPTRANLRKAEWHVFASGARTLKLSPLADWPQTQVWAYLEAHHIDALPLYAQGYTSIGCEPCTSLPSDPANARSGRWGGQKLECGIHTGSQRP